MSEDCMDCRSLLAELGKNRMELGRQLPALKHYQNFKRAIYQGNSLSTKEKTLIALSIAVVKQCKYCITSYVKDAVDAGATDQEIIEACGVAILMGGGPAIGYSTFVQSSLAEIRNPLQEHRSSAGKDKE